MKILLGENYELQTQELDEHVESIDKQLIEEYTNQGYTDNYFSLLKQRWFTYKEYLTLFTSDIHESEFYDHPLFQFLKIEAEIGYHNGTEKIIGRKDFTLTYSADIHGYHQLLYNQGFTQSKLSTQKRMAAISYKRMWEHAYINGASGSGKSTLIKKLIFDLSHKKNSIVLIDAQGKLASEVAALKQLNTDRLVYFKPNLQAGFSPVLNVLEKDDDQDSNALALRLARVISIISQGELSNPMISLLRPCLAVLLEQKESSLRDLKKFILKEENADLVQLGLAHPDTEYKSTFKRINAGYYNKTREAILSKLDVILQDQTFRHLTTGKSTINLRQCIEQKKIVIFDLGGLDSDTIQAFGRLVVALLLQIAFERKVKRMKQHTRTFLVIDEMQNFLSPDLIKILDEARQKKLHLIMAHQRIGQLKSHIKTNLEESFVDSMMGNTAIKIVGHNDSPDTINILASKLGMDKTKLVSLPNYEFLLRVRGKSDVHFKSSPAINDKKLYRTKKEIREMEKYMLRQYYRPTISAEARSSGEVKTKEADNREQVASTREVTLPEDDF